MARAKTPGIYNANGLWQIGPMILRWGTEEQQQMWLPGILNADVHWCQGFTEPEAGSDLANLRTLAVLDGDEYVVTGRKIWISTAHLAKWGLFLVRTDPGAIERGAKHEGITALIVDMELPGIEVNVIRDITGGELFCEVNFDGARVPAAYRLGEENQGWNVAMGTLANERVGTSGLSVSMRIELDNLIATARRNNPEALDDPGIRDRIARLWTQLELTRLLNARALSKILKGEKNWPEVPLAKLQWSYLSQTIAELGVDILGRVGGPRTRRPGRRGQGALEPQLRVAALHVDRRRHHRGAEEHHRRPRHQDAPSLTYGSASLCVIDAHPESIPHPPELRPRGLRRGVRGPLRPPSPQAAGKCHLPLT